MRFVSFTVAKWTFGIVAQSLLQHVKLWSAGKLPIEDLMAHMIEAGASTLASANVCATPTCIPHNRCTKNRLSSMVRMCKILSICLWARPQVMGDFKESDMNTLYVEQDGIGLPDPKYYTDNPQAIAAYKELVASFLTNAGVVTGNGANEAKVLCVVSMPNGYEVASAVLCWSGNRCYGHPHWFGQVRKFFTLQLVVDFEAKLATIRVPQDELRDPRVTYNPHTVEQV